MPPVELDERPIATKKIQPMLPATARDVDRIYRLVLERFSECPQCADHLGAAVHDAVAEIVASPEFAELIEDLRRHQTLPPAKMVSEEYRAATEVAIESGLAPVGLVMFYGRAHNAENLEARIGGAFGDAAHRITFARETAKGDRDEIAEEHDRLAQESRTANGGRHPA